VRKDNSRPLNISHEYQLVFLESADYSTNQVVLKTGKIIDFPTRNPDSLMVFGNVKSPNLLWTTPFTPNVWHNFGLILNFASKYADSHHWFLFFELPCFQWLTLLFTLPAPRK
jgi:hypothetical protein